MVLVLRRTTFLIWDGGQKPFWTAITLSWGSVQLSTATLLAVHVLLLCDWWKQPFCFAWCKPGLHDQG